MTDQSGTARRQLAQEDASLGPQSQGFLRVFDCRLARPARSGSATWQYRPSNPSFPSICSICLIFLSISSLITGLKRQIE